MLFVDETTWVTTREKVKVNFAVTACWTEGAGSRIPEMHNRAHGETSMYPFYEEVDAWRLLETKGGEE